MIRWLASLLLCFWMLPSAGALAQRNAHDDLEEALRDLPEAQRTEYRRQLLQLDRVSRRLLQAIPRPPQVNFILAAGEKSVNAGATFGKIIVAEGLMRFVQSDDELAMILGHELAHLTEGHVSRGAMNNVLLNIGSLIVGSFIPGGDAAANVAGQLFLNRFNQEQEREADHVGLRYAYDAGYDPVAAAYVMRRMAEEIPETANAGFFSSHPSSAERFETLHHEAAALRPDHETRRTAAEEIGPRASRSFQRDEALCRQARPFFIRAKNANNPDQKIALYQRGLRLCPQSPRAHAELADVYASLGETREAVAEYHEALRYDPDFPGARRRLEDLEGRWSRRN
ncbi:MAG: M48 family metalloprotease [Candidatus Binatia bacterium]